MSDWRRELENELAAEADEYEALVEHIFDEGGRRPQGLHQGGWKPFGDPEPWEDEAVVEHQYADPYLLDDL